MCLSPRLAHLSSFFSSSFGSFIFLLYIRRPPISIFFFLNDTATPEIYPLPLHDALPIFETSGSRGERARNSPYGPGGEPVPAGSAGPRHGAARRVHRRAEPRGRQARSDESARRSRARSEEHTSELQSLAYLVCRLLLEKK